VYNTAICTQDTDCGVGGSCTYLNDMFFLSPSGHVLWGALNDQAQVISFTGYYNPSNKGAITQSTFQSQFISTVNTICGSYCAGWDNYLTWTTPFSDTATGTFATVSFDVRGWSVSGQEFNPQYTVGNALNSWANYYIATYSLTSGGTPLLTQVPFQSNYQPNYLPFCPNGDSGFACQDSCNYYSQNSYRFLRMLRTAAGLTTTDFTPAKTNRVGFCKPVVATADINDWSLSTNLYTQSGCDITITGLVDASTFVTPPGANEASTHEGALLTVFSAALAVVVTWAVQQ